MPWKTTSKQEQRFELVRQMIAGQESVIELCRRFKISRQTAYKWRSRYRSGRLSGLRDRSRCPARLARQTSRLWLRRLRHLRVRRRTWGARKLRHRLAVRFGPSGLPAPATIGRWLKRWGMTNGRPRRPRGPVMMRRAVRAARHCNDVWTVDFKGWYRTAKGIRVDPLTVRDLYSRFGLGIVLLPGQGVVRTQRTFVRIFKQYGLPDRIRCDNGTPFGGGGPTGLTRLSAWWVKLGIEVEFITPGRPCENGAHEQFHRVYKAEVAREPEPEVVAQQRRSTRWLREYNYDRPHEALRMRVPADLFKKAKRCLPRRIRPWRYPARWKRRWVRGNGEISWRGVRRYVGEAFVKDHVGLKPVGTGKWKVYFGPLLIGQLHDVERGSIRMAQYQHGR